MADSLRIYFPKEIEATLAGLAGAGRYRCSEYRAALEDAARAFGVRGPDVAAGDGPWESPPTEIVVVVEGAG